MSRTRRKKDPDMYYENRGYKYDDKKAWYKPGRVFKTMMKKVRRARERSAMRSGRVIPLFRKTDEWDYN